VLNITHYKESAAVRNLKPEWWGSPLVQEEKYQEKPVKIIIIIIIIIIIVIIPLFVCQQQRSYNRQTLLNAYIEQKQMITKQN
jgi:hypothetical protein